MPGTGSITVAFADLQWLRRFAAMLARDPDEAEDLVQETLVVAWADPPRDALRPARDGAVEQRGAFRVRVEQVRTAGPGTHRRGEAVLAAGDAAAVRREDQRGGGSACCKKNESGRRANTRNYTTRINKQFIFQTCSER